MNLIKKIFCLSTAASMMFSASDVRAQEYYPDFSEGQFENQYDGQYYEDYDAGYAYEASRNGYSYAPYIAVGTIVIIAIVTIAVTRGGGHGSSSHSHS